MARRHKRLWTDEEKRSICTQARADGVSVAQVAQRYALNANMIHKWLRDPRYRDATVEPTSDDEAVYDDGDVVEMRASGAAFIPVEMVEADAGDGGAEVDTPSPSGRDVARWSDGPQAVAPQASQGLIELDLAGGHRLRITGSYDAEALSHLIRALTA